MRQARHALYRLRFVLEPAAPLLRFLPQVTTADIAQILGATTDQRLDPTGAIEGTSAPNLQQHSYKTPASIARRPLGIASGRDLTR